jgi:hypothetical protein
MSNGGRGVIDEEDIGWRACEIIKALDLVSAESLATLDLDHPRTESSQS